MFIFLGKKQVNAAYFKGQWASQFKVANTRLTSFAINNKEEGVANMMFQKGRFRHGIIYSILWLFYCLIIKV